MRVPLRLIGQLFQLLASLTAHRLEIGAVGPPLLLNIHNRFAELLDQLRTLRPGLGALAIVALPVAARPVILAEGEPRLDVREARFHSRVRAVELPLDVNTLCVAAALKTSEQDGDALGELLHLSVRSGEPRSGRPRCNRLQRRPGGNSTGQGAALHERPLLPDDPPRDLRGAHAADAINAGPRPGLWRPQDLRDPRRVWHSSARTRRCRLWPPAAKRASVSHSFGRRPPSCAHT